MLLYYGTFAFLPRRNFLETGRWGVNFTQLLPPFLCTLPAKNVKKAMENQLDVRLTLNSLAKFVTFSASLYKSLMSS